MSSEDSIISIDSLQDQGINAGDINKLKSAGICSITVCWARLASSFLLFHQ